MNIGVMTFKREDTLGETVSCGEQDGALKSFTDVHFPNSQNEASGQSEKINEKPLSRDIPITLKGVDDFQNKF